MRTFINRVQLLGNLGADPEFKELDGGKSVAKFSLATHYKNANGEEQTQWHNLIAWGKTAEIVANYLTKGNRVAIEGRLNNRSYEDKQGVKRYVTEIVVNDLLMLGSKKESA